jgi:predicted nucleic acid-binding protein
MVTVGGPITEGLLDENDLWIAATALALYATLISRDSDFHYIDGLKVENWTT